MKILCITHVHVYTYALAYTPRNIIHVDIIWGDTKLRGNQIRDPSACLDTWNKQNKKEVLPWKRITHPREFEMFCSMMSWSPSLSGRILTEKQPLWSMLPMAVTLTLSPSLTSSEQSAIRQIVACWSVAIGEQIHKMCSREGREMEQQEEEGKEGWDHTHHWSPWHVAALGADSVFSLCAHTQRQSWRTKPTLHIHTHVYVHDTKNV